MNAQKLASELKVLGINPVRVVEPQAHEDGEIVVSNGVHVQVPLMGDCPNVVRETSIGEFAFGESRHSIQDLVTDIQSALREESSDLSA